MLANMESVRKEYTIRYNVYSVRSWLNNSNVVTENLYWTTNLKRVKHKLKAVKKVYQDELKGIDLDNETREYILDKKCYIDTAHIVCREVYYSDPIPYVEGTITTLGGK